MLIGGGGVLYCLAGFGFYFLAAAEDRSCRGGRGTPRRTIEDCLYLYVEKPCSENERVNGISYEEGTCVSYEILGFLPIQVIYDDRDLIITRIPAYE
jgi:hypothetical protein